jgi:succinoglycan biosynthesis protein ExoA
MVVSDLSCISDGTGEIAREPGVETPLVSVVVPVRNEARHLGRTLGQLTAQQYDPRRFEILVIDGRSDDGTWELAAKFAERFGNVRVFSNPRRLSSAARNIGVRHAQGDIIVVIDGHCELGDRYLARLVDAFERSGADCIGRPQPLDVSNATGLQRAIAAARSSPLGHHPASHIYSAQEGFVPAKSVAVAYRRSVFDAVGLFDETFDACEDVEFNHRVDRAGLRCYLAPDVSVHYQPRSTLRGLFYQLLRYGRGRIRLLRKHPETLSWATLLPLVFVVGLFAGLPLALAAILPRMIYVAAIVAYAAIVSLGSFAIGVSRKNLQLVPQLVAVVATIHLGSGIGMLLETIRFRQPAESRTQGGSIRSGESMPLQPSNVTCPLPLDGRGAGGEDGVNALAAAAESAHS